MLKKTVKLLSAIDRKIIHTLGIYSRPIDRLALFIVFFWFGILKVFMASPANPLVEALQQQTLPFLTFHTFIICFGIYEMIIGLLFLWPGAERVAIALLLPHMVTTIMPLILLPTITWHAVFVPTLEGQYIIKNVVIIALAFSIAARLHPMKRPWF